MTYFHKGCTASHKSHRYRSALVIVNIQHAEYSYHQKIWKDKWWWGDNVNADLVGRVNLQALTISTLQF